MQGAAKERQCRAWLVAAVQGAAGGSRFGYWWLRGGGGGGGGLLDK